MKKLPLIIILCLLSLGVFATEDIIQYPKERANPNDFLIMPWSGYISEGYKFSHKAYFQDLYECGFNVSGFVAPDMIKEAKENNIMASVYVDGIKDKKVSQAQSNSWAKKVKKLIPEEFFSNVYQVYVKDEPGIKDIKNVKLYTKAIKEIIGCKSYVNLMPNYAGETLLGNDYGAYCDKVVQNCGLDFISYDNYSYYVTGLNEDRFYSNLEDISRAAKRNEVPFVNVILGSTFLVYGQTSDYSIHVQGWSTLAYGGRGISYFVFHNVPIGNHRGGAYDRFGSKTLVWNYIRNMNFAIHNIMPYYKDLEHINTFHIGYIPKGSNGKETSINFNKLEFGFNIKTDEKPNVVVGEFIGKTDGKEYAIIVNKSEKYSVKVKSIEFNTGKKITHIRDYSLKNPERKFDGEDMWISPGHGVLLRAD